MIGLKLIGQGSYAEWEMGGTYNYLKSGFNFTNPDCVSEITIDRVSIFDIHGDVVYEDPLLWLTREDDELEAEEWTEPMKPHETRFIELGEYIEWVKWEPAPAEHDIEGMLYTVEIFWTWTDKKGLPLTGWALTAYALFDNEGNLVEVSTTETQMVNMEQELETKEN